MVISENQWIKFLTPWIWSGTELDESCSIICIRMHATRLNLIQETICTIHRNPEQHILERIIDASPRFADDTNILPGYQILCLQARI